MAWREKQIRAALKATVATVRQMALSVQICLLIDSLDLAITVEKNLFLVESIWLMQPFVAVAALSSYAASHLIKSNN